MLDSAPAAGLAAAGLAAVNSLSAAAAISIATFMAGDIIPPLSPRTKQRQQIESELRAADEAVVIADWRLKTARYDFAIAEHTEQMWDMILASHVKSNSTATATAAAAN